MSSVNQKIKVKLGPPSASSGNVNSVFGRTGTIVAENGDYTTDLVTEVTDKKYVTDAEKTILSNTSGTNTGDETTGTIQTKRPLKTVGGESLEGPGNIEIPDSAAWGNITGTLSNQTDLQSELDLKANLSDAVIKGANNISSDIEFNPDTASSYNFIAGQGSNPFGYFGTRADRNEFYTPTFNSYLSIDGSGSNEYVQIWASDSTKWGDIFASTAANQGVNLSQQDEAYVHSPSGNELRPYVQLNGGELRMWLTTSSINTDGKKGFVISDGDISVHDEFYGKGMKYDSLSAYTNINWLSDDDYIPSIGMIKANVRGDVESVNGESGVVVLTGEDIETSSGSGVTIKQDLDSKLSSIPNAAWDTVGGVKMSRNSTTSRTYISFDGSDTPNVT